MLIWRQLSIRFHEKGQMMNRKELLNNIQNLSKPAIVGISGFGGAGKSTLANDLAKTVGGYVVGVDAFFKNTTDENYSLWEIIDFDRLEQEVLVPFQEGRDISYSAFDWENNTLGQKQEMPTTDLLIVEGVGLFRPNLMQYFDFSIWIDCPLDVAIARGKKRDKEEYGQDHDQLWDGLWQRNDQDYQREYRPKETATTIYSADI